VRSGVDVSRHFIGSALNSLVSKSPKHKSVLRGAGVLPGAKHNLCVRSENHVVPVLDMGAELLVRQWLQNRGMDTGSHPIFGVFHADVWIGEHGGIWFSIWVVRIWTSI
jgi:hypothetical protein